MAAARSEAPADQRARRYQFTTTIAREPETGMAAVGEAANAFNTD
jgi:hypothetical protein